MARRKRTRTIQRKLTKGGKPTHSIYPGVTFERGAYRRKPWKAVVHTNGKGKHVGRFATEEEAAKAYRDALLVYPL
jgi:hypothetical protein